jgi:hypothetical protein
MNIENLHACVSPEFSEIFIQQATKTLQDPNSYEYQLFDAYFLLNKGQLYKKPNASGAFIDVLELD